MIFNHGEKYNFSHLFFSYDVIMLKSNVCNILYLITTKDRQVNEIKLVKIRS